MPKWRPFTWVIVIINVLFLIWIIAAIAGSTDTANDCGSLSQEDCDTAVAAGTAIGVGIIIFFLAFLDVILGVLWLVTRPKRRPCPVCGTEVKTGVLVCPKCGYDFRTAGQVAPPPGQAPPMPPAPS